MHRHSEFPVQCAYILLASEGGWVTQVCRFRFRLPGGQHIERRFLSSDTLQVGGLVGAGKEGLRRLKCAL